MIAGWLAGKLSGIIIFVMACLMPITAIGWGYEAVKLHGIGFTGPFGIHVVLAHGAILDRDNAIKDKATAETARDAALRDLATAHKSISNLEGGLGQCNDSIAKLAKTGNAIQDAASKLAALAAKGQDQLKGNLAAVQAIQSTAEKCPAADAIVTRGFQ